MLKDILFAGFGGQGIQFCSKVVANAALLENKELSWLPSYGPEMRGGTSNCAVCIDDEPIASPLVSSPRYLMVLNAPSYDKFINLVQPGGTVIYDSSLINADTERSDIDVFGIPATRMANDNDLKGGANIIELGYMIKKTDILSLDIIKTSIEKMSKGRQQLIANNFRALQLGYEYSE